MRRIKGYFRFGKRESIGYNRHARALKDRGQPVEWRTEFSEAVRCLLPRLRAAPGVQPVLWQLGGLLHPAPRARRAGLHSEENPAAAIQILCCV